MILNNNNLTRIDFDTDFDFDTDGLLERVSFGASAFPSTGRRTGSGQSPGEHEIRFQQIV